MRTTCIEHASILKSTPRYAARVKFYSGVQYPAMEEQLDTEYTLPIDHN